MCIRDRPKDQPDRDGPRIRMGHAIVTGAGHAARWSHRRTMAAARPPAGTAPISAIPDVRDFGRSVTRHMAVRVMSVDAAEAPGPPSELSGGNSSRTFRPL